MTVHPRWRGEQQDDLIFSPSRPRFIPAGAGNRPAEIWTRIFPVHPRWRGEQLGRAGDGEPIPGSSPHGAGNQRGPTWGRRRSGSSPLARGTGGRAGPTDMDAVHPRWRGERPPRPPPATPRAVHPRWRGEQGIAHGPQG